MRSLKNVLFVVMILGLLLSACKPQVVVQTVEVKETVQVKEVVQVKETVQVQSTVEVPVAVTPTMPAPVTIRVMNFSQEQTAFYQEATQIFHEQFPWITVQWDTLAQADYNETLPLMFQSGDSPDIFVYYAHRGTYFELAELLEQGWVQPYDETALDPGFRERFYNTRSLMDPLYSRDGKIYAFPRDAQGPYEHGYMWYNKAILKAAGFDPATDVPKTWDQLKEVCKAIRSTTEAYCLSIPNNSATELHRIMIPWLAVNGANWRSWETGLTNASAPEVVAAVEKLREFYAEDLVLPGINDKNFARAAVANGAAAIYFDGSWMASVWATNYGWTGEGVAMPPAPDDSGYQGKVPSSLDYPNLFLSSQSKHPYEASLFVNWITQPDGWFVTQYLARGFGFLAFADNERYVVNPVLKSLVPLAPQMRVIGPNVALNCPDTSSSKATANVDAFRPNWIFEALSEYLLNGGPGGWEAIAKEIDAQQNEIFVTTLNEEKAAGLDVSPECWAAPAGWDRLTDIDYSIYFK